MYQNFSYDDQIADYNSIYGNGYRAYRNQVMKQDYYNGNSDDWDSVDYDHDSLNRYLKYSEAY